MIRRLRVDEFELPDILARGQAPEACGAELEWCELSGIADTLGPILIASVRGSESELAWGARATPAMRRPNPHFLQDTKIATSGHGLGYAP